VAGPAPGRAPEIKQQKGLRVQGRRCAGGRLRGERFGEVQAKRRQNFTEIKKNRAQQYGGDRGCHPNVGYLADTASGIVMPISMGVRGDLQQEEKRKQRERNDNRGYPPAVRPAPIWLRCAPCEQTLPPRIGRNNPKNVPPHCCPKIVAAQGRKDSTCANGLLGRGSASGNRPFILRYPGVDVEYVE